MVKWKKPTINVTLTAFYIRSKPVAIALTKDSVDLGIVTNNADAMVAFYKDLLGFEFQGTMEMPGGNTMHRLLCGTSLIKIVQNAKPPKAEAPGGGIGGATGYRYWTMSVSNLEEITQQCADAGHKVAVPVTVIRPGVRISMVEDPDGNWVEFLEQS
jgi:glyoxylase I family protein